MFTLFKKVLLFSLILTNSIFIFGQENAIHLDGTNDYVNCGNNASINIIGNSITLEAWIYPTSFKTNVWEGNVINKNGSGDNGYMIRVGNSGQVNFNIGNGSWNEINSATGAVTLNTWHHVAGTYDGTTIRLYINGVQVASSALTGNIGNTTTNLLLGEDPQWTGRYFPGRIEEVKIWNVARTAAQVISDMNYVPCAPLPTGLVAYYRFNQGTAGGANAGVTSVTDQTGVNNGTLINSALSGALSNWVAGKPAFPAASAAFTMAANGCTAATATVTGTAGGTFSFNPAPGGGVTINSSTGSISNGTAGATYTVQYTVCGVSSTQSVTLSSGTPTFTTAVTNCTQATCSITGTSGGVFSFNPSPGGSVTINSATGAVNNGTPGSTYTIQYSVCGNSSISSIIMQSINCWNLNGSAQWITSGAQQCIQLTDEINNQTGCAWDDNILNFSSNFSLSLNYYFGNNVNGADGTTFTFQPSPTACGTAGGQIGAGSIANSLVIEFDTYDNDNPTHAVDIAADHIAIEVDGNLLNSTHLAGPVAALASNANIDDGNIHTVNIQWNASTQTLSVFFDGSLRLSTTYNIVANVFGGDPTVRWGATGATGGLNNQQYFCPQSIVILPTEMTSFTAECVDEEQWVRWTTASEDRVDYFEVEYTTDGIIFYPLAQIDAAGTTDQTQNYSANSELDIETQVYYRVKTVDIDGNIETSELISGKNCKQQQSLNGYIFENGELLLDLSTEDVVIELINPTGQLISRFSDKSLKGLQLAEGLYVLRITVASENRAETYRLYHTKH